MKSKYILPILFGFAGFMIAGMVYPGHGNKNIYIGVGVAIGVFIALFIQGIAEVLGESKKNKKK